jgi:shikimate dehydrogenase
LTVTGRTRLAAVIGDPVGHSLSPVIHNAAFQARHLDWVFVALEVPEGSAGEALAGMRAMGIRGLSVTMPHKAAVLPHLDEVGEDAAALGAVNCVTLVDGRLVGANTDGPGFIDSVEEQHVEVAGCRVLVLGAGGAGRAVVRALGRSGAAEIGVVNRGAERREQAVALGGPAARGAEAAEAPDFEVVVNATPIGMGDRVALPLDAGLLTSDHVVVDLVYEPLDTALLTAARAAGAQAIDGVGMLVHQAGRAFRQWTGQDPPIEAMTTAARTALSRSGGKT